MTFVRLRLALVGLVVCSSPLRADPKAYFEYEPGFFGTEVLTIDGQKIELSRWSGTYNVGNAMADTPAAQAQYELHLEHASKVQLGLWGSIAAVVGFTLAKSNAAQLAFGAAYLGGFGYSIYQAQQSRKAIYRAVNMYNGLHYQSASLASPNCSFGLAALHCEF